jgi:hypothetical protein
MNALDFISLSPIFSTLVQSPYNLAIYSNVSHDPSAEPEPSARSFRKRLHAYSCESKGGLAQDKVELLKLYFGCHGLNTVQEWVAADRSLDT